LTNDGVDLNLALINYGLDFLRKKSYKKVQAPFMMNKDMMSQTAQLSEFDEALYKVSLPAHNTAELTIRSLEEMPRTNTSLLPRNSLSLPCLPMKTLRLASYL
jgi:seryl-tRNA synthetase